MNRRGKVISWIVAVAVVVAISIIGGRLRDEPAKSNTAIGSSPGWTIGGGIGSSGQGAKTFDLPVAKTYGGVGSLIDLDGLTVAQFVEKHRPEARAGDARAAYRIFEAEALCAHIDTLKGVAEAMKASKNAGEYALRVAEAEKACVGVTPALLYERYQFLAQAADGGVDEARIAFFWEGPAGHTAGTPIDPEVTGQMIGYLRTSGEKGNPYALYLLSGVYQDGQVVQKDPIKALVYRAAAFELRPGAPVVLEDLATIKKMSAGLTPDQIAAALQQGRQLAAQAKKGKQS